MRTFRLFGIAPLSMMVKVNTLTSLLLNVKVALMVLIGLIVRLIRGNE